MKLRFIVVSFSLLDVKIQLWYFGVVYTALHTLCRYTVHYIYILHIQYTYCSKIIIIQIFGLLCISTAAKKEKTPRLRLKVAEKLLTDTAIK